MRAWRRRAACRTPHDPLPWMRVIARREALRHLARRADVALPGEDMGALPAAPDPAPDAAERVDLRRAVAALAQAERQVVWLRYAADLTQPGVAQMLAIPEGTVKVRLHRARQHLREALSA